MRPGAIDGAGFKATGGVSHHYQTMRTRDIAAVPVADVAALDCCLFLWATCPRLGDALRVMDAWGFRFSTVAFVWVKLNPGGRGWWSGLGRWTNSNVELCFLGVRGRPERLVHTVKQLVIAPRGRHSAKPEAVQDRIERLTTGPRLELFARRQRPGWTCTGLDLDGVDVRDALARLAALPQPADEPAPTEPGPGPRRHAQLHIPWLEKVS